MIEQRQLDNSHPSGRTTGTLQRPPHEHTGTLMAFDLGAELERLHQEESWQRGVRNARTLVKERDLRVVLVALKAGARMERHTAPGRMTLQVTAGRIRLGIPERAVDLAPGQMLELDRDVPHDVEALEESAFLLTIAWPSGLGER